MKACLVYWIVGCLIVGFGYGHRINKCQSEVIDVSDMVSMVAVWPAVVGLSFAGHIHYPACEQALSPSLGTFQQ